MDYTYKHSHTYSHICALSLTHTQTCLHIYYRKVVRKLGKKLESQRGRKYREKKDRVGRDTERSWDTERVVTYAGEIEDPIMQGTHKVTWR